MEGGSWEAMGSARSNTHGILKSKWSISGELSFKKHYRLLTLNGVSGENFKVKQLENSFGRGGLLLEHDFLELKRSNQKAKLCNHYLNYFFNIKRSTLGFLSTFFIIIYFKLLVLGICIFSQYHPLLKSKTSCPCLLWILRIFDQNFLFLAINFILWWIGDETLPI